MVGSACVEPKSELTQVFFMQNELSRSAEN